MLIKSVCFFGCIATVNAFSRLNILVSGLIIFSYISILISGGSLMHCALNFQKCVLCVSTRVTS